MPYQGDETIIIVFSTGSTSGDIYCGDLGEEAQEEINHIKKGHNYGWDIKEGALCNHHSCNLTGYNNIQPVQSPYYLKSEILIRA